MKSSTLVTLSLTFAGMVFVAGCAGVDSPHEYEKGRPRYDTGSAAYRYSAVRPYEGNSALDVLQRPAISRDA